MIRFSKPYNLLGEKFNQVLDFSGSDMKDLFEQNLIRGSKDWYYRTTPITYKYNSQGHRCNDIESLDFENYVLFLGASDTVGTGLELEKTYPYLVSKSLGTSYYNLSVGGVGVDSLFYNLNMWLNQFPKPKYISLCWHDPARFLTEVNDKKDVFISVGHWTKDDDQKNMFRYGDASGYFDTRLKLQCNMIKSLLEFHKIPHANISVSQVKLYEIPIKIFNMVDYARDSQHPGIKTNQLVAEYLIEQYHDKYTNAAVINTGTVQISHQRD